MFKLYIGNKNYSSWSLRPWVLMRARSIPFEERLEPFAKGSSWEKFRKFSPNGRVPCLHDGGTVIWDSLAIAEYLAESHAGVWPRDDTARAWARSAASEMHSGFAVLRDRCPMNCGLRVTLHDIGADLRADIRRIDEIWGEGLERFGGPFLCGPDFGATDAFFAPVAFRVQTFGLELSDAAHAYVEQLLEHPAMQDWYHAALKEPWRETGHEEEIAATGTIQADYRDLSGAGAS
jgi:glutathione S-transferase